MKHLGSLFGLVLGLNIFLSSPTGFAKVKELKQKLTKYSHQISKLEAEINQIDKELANKNDLFLKDQAHLTSMESTLKQKRAALEESAQAISNQYQKAQKSYRLFLLQSTEGETEDDLVMRKIYEEVLKSKIASLSQSQSESKTILARISELEQQVTHLKKSEGSLYSYIIDLENKKKGVGETYLSLMEEHNSLQQELDKLMARENARKTVAKKKLKKSRHQLLSLPLDSFDQIKKGKKGLTLTYKGVVPVKAPGTGRVIYVGELASYGQVIMVDHGQQVKSVLLGDLSIRVKKGETVKNNQILGYTISDKEISKSLYFEVRKKNQVQNTANWIAPSSKNKII